MDSKDENVNVVNNEEVPDEDNLELVYDAAEVADNADHPENDNNDSIIYTPVNSFYEEYQNQGEEIAEENKVETNEQGNEEVHEDDAEPENEIHEVNLIFNEHEIPEEVNHYMEFGMPPVDNLEVDLGSFAGEGDQEEEENKASREDGISTENNEELHQENSERPSFFIDLSNADEEGAERELYGDVHDSFENDDVKKQEQQKEINKKNDIIPEKFQENPEEEIRNSEIRNSEIRNNEIRNSEIKNNEIKNNGQKLIDTMSDEKAANYARIADLAERCRGMFRDSDEYKAFNWTAQFCAGLANIVNSAKKNGTEVIEFNTVDRKMARLIKKMPEFKDRDSISPEEAGRLLSSARNDMVKNARAYVNYKFKDHTFDTKTERNKKAMNSDDRLKLKLMQKILPKNDPMQEMLAPLSKKMENEQPVNVRG